MHGDDDQIVPSADSALLSAKLLKNGTLKVYEKLPHGMCTTHAEVINPDLLAFIVLREAFLLQSWLDHLRPRERVTESEPRLQAQI